MAIPPRENNTLALRIVVFDGKADAAIVEQYCDAAERSTLRFV